MVLAIDTNSGMYKLLLVLHLLAVVVGIGGVTLNALYGMAAERRKGGEGLAIAETNLHVSLVAERFIYAAFPLGLLLVWASDGAWELSQTWVWLSITIYVAALGVSHGIVIPTAKAMNGLMRDLVARPAAPGGPPPEVAQLQALGKKIGMSSMLLHLATVSLVALMVWKPGA
jgi:hypothetical protein